MQHLNAMEDFQRDISFRLLKREHEILMTSIMKDRFHDVFLEVIADIETLVVISARVEFRKAPTSDCPNVSQSLAGLVGMTIGKGMTRRILESLGGCDGCGNLRNMLQGLLPLALNLKAAAGISDEKEMLANIRNQLIGTCAGYVRSR